MRVNLASLGDTQCDVDGNCYTDGVLTAAPLTSSPGQVGNVTPGSVTGWLSQNSTLVVAGAAIIGLIFTVSGRR